MANSQMPGSQINNLTVRNTRSNKFYNLSYPHLSTERYGEITPFGFCPVIEDAKVKFSPSFNLRNYTLKSPLMQGVSKYIDTFYVPMSKILPRTWDYILSQPAHGDDINANTANCLFPVGPVVSLIKNIFLILNKNQTVTYYTYDNLCRLFVSCYLFFGYDSLFTRFKRPLTKCLKLGYSFVNPDTHHRGFDFVYGESVLNFLFRLVFVDFVGPLRLYSKDYTDSTGNDYFDIASTLGDKETFSDAELNKVLQFCYRYPDFTFDNGSIVKSLPSSAIAPLGNLFANIVFTIPVKPFNINHLLAYKMTVAEYFSNSKIDDITSAEQYRSYYDSIMLMGLQPTQTYPVSFEHNGTMVFYDSFSGIHFSNFIGGLGTAIEGAFSKYLSIFHLFMDCLFGKDYSFKFQDYFTSLRTSPLSIANSDAPVTDDKVGALDLTKSILMGRFSVAVARVGNKMRDYRSKILGNTFTDDIHDIKQLSSQKFSLNGVEVENTADNQGNITTLLRSSAQKYMFDYVAPERGVLLALTWYDMQRFYLDAVTRFAFHYDRYDEYNPYLENVGDQEITNYEYGTDHMDLDPEPFGYGSRYGEYKLSVSQASGAFGSDTAQLDSWALTQPAASSKITPDFIRSHPDEFDRFYASLTGLGVDYFHFVVRYDNAFAVHCKIDNNPPLLF